MKLGWFVYFMIGMGVAASNPFETAAPLSQFSIVFAWPAWAVRDAVNFAYTKHGREALEKESEE